MIHRSQDREIENGGEQSIYEDDELPKRLVKPREVSFIPLPHPAWTLHIGPTVLAEGVDTADRSE